MPTKPKCDIKLDQLITNQVDRIKLLVEVLNRSWNQDLDLEASQVIAIELFRSSKILQEMLTNHLSK